MSLTGNGPDDARYLQAYGRPASSVFARRLAQARNRAGLSQTQLGVLAGLDPSVASPRINQYERGKHEPQLGTAKRLAEVLGIPPAYLYAEDDSLAELLLIWADMSVTARKKLVRQLAAAHSSKAKKKPDTGR